LIRLHLDADDVVTDEVTVIAVCAIREMLAYGASDASLDLGRRTAPCRRGMLLEGPGASRFRQEPERIDGEWVRYSLISRAESTSVGRPSASEPLSGIVRHGHSSEAHNHVGHCQLDNLSPASAGLIFW
jgi:hypothetical protein